MGLRALQWPLAVDMPGEYIPIPAAVTTMLCASPRRDSPPYASGYATLDTSAGLVVEATVC